MTIKEDMERCKGYGRDVYYQTIQNYPSYQAELERTRTDYKPRSWVQSPIALPKIPTQEFEKRRVAYVKKYGSRIQVPQDEDILHLDLPVHISQEEMAAHRWASKHKLPSPLEENQLKELTKKRYRFLRMLSSPEPYAQQVATSFLTAMDNAEDALVTLSVIGRLAIKLIPKIAERVTPVLGWALLGSDILNMFNVMAALHSGANSKKRLHEKTLDGNPFHEKAKAARAKKLGKTWPGFGEFLEIAQTADQMFGAGLCLGGIMGTFQDSIDQGMLQIAKAGANVAATAMYPSAWKTIWADAIDSATLLWSGSPDFVPYEMHQVAIAATGFMQEQFHFAEIKDALEFIPGIQDLEKKLKPPKNWSTIWNLEDLGIDPLASLMWPVIEKPAATLEEINLALAPKIKNNFQTYLLDHSKDERGRITGQAASAYTQGLISTLADDNQVTISHTSWSQVLKEMHRDSIYFPEGTSTLKQQQFLNWANDYERKYNLSPSMREVENAGNLLGIKWERTQPKKLDVKAKDLFPGWDALQDQIGFYNIAD